MLHHSLKLVPKGGVGCATPQQEAPGLRHAANMVTLKTARSHVAPSALPRTHQACMVLWTSWGGGGGPIVGSCTVSGIFWVSLSNLSAPQEASGCPKALVGCM